MELFRFSGWIASLILIEKTLVDCYYKGYQACAFQTGGAAPDSLGP